MSHSNEKLSCLSATFAEQNTCSNSSATQPLVEDPAPSMAIPSPPNRHPNEAHSYLAMLAREEPLCEKWSMASESTERKLNE